MSRPIMIMMVGVPGSGKSTRAKELAVEFNAQIFSSDAIRAELYGDEEYQGNNEKVFRVLETRLLGCLKSGCSVIYDATNIHSKFRAHFVRTVRAVSDAYCRCEIVATEPNECYWRNLRRYRVVPNEVIDRMTKQFQVPVPVEGWDEIRIFHSKKFDIYNYADGVWKMDQMNSHHSLTLGDHMEQTRLWFVKNKRCEPMEVVAGLHDIGKPITMTFTKPNGEKDTEAHYYGHENVGAYLMLCCDQWGFVGDMTLIQMARLVQYHMLPYSAPKEGDKKQWLIGVLSRKGLDENFAEALLDLHEADRSAH